MPLVYVIAVHRKGVSLVIKHFSLPPSITSKILALVCLEWSGKLQVPDKKVIKTFHGKYLHRDSFQQQDISYCFGCVCICTPSS